MSTYLMIQSGITIAKIHVDTDIVLGEFFQEMCGFYSNVSLMDENQKRIIGLGQMSRYEAIIELLQAFDGERMDQMQFDFKNAHYESTDGIHFCERYVKWPIDMYAENGIFKGLILPTAQMTTFFIQEDASHPVIESWRQLVNKCYYIQSIVRTDVITRDQVRLSTIVMLPKTNKPVSTILIRTPYGKENIRDLFKVYVLMGYAVIIQDVRGRNQSGGDPYIPKIFDKNDGDDTINWIVENHWSNKKVGMIGASYLGYVQWAAASSGNPYLKAIVSLVTAGSAFIDLPRKGGTFLSGGFALAFGLATKEFKPEMLIRDDWDKLLKVRPIEKIPVVGLGHEIPYVNEELAHQDNDDFWKLTDFKTEQITNVPALIVTGWFDDNQAGSLEALSMIEKGYIKNYRVIIGPWMHKGNSNREINGFTFSNDAIKYDLDLNYHQWLNQYLNLDQVENNTSVEYYTVGLNKWETVKHWPIKSIKEDKFYLSIGTLGSEPTQGMIEYTYNPHDPAPHLIDISQNELSLPNDYQEVVKRDDVLLFKTEPYLSNQIYTGTFKVCLNVSSTAVDTDFVVRVLKIDELGRHMSLADGFLTAKYRHSFEKPEWLTPGEKTLIRIETSMVSIQVKAGERLALMVTSSAEGYIFPHSNTKEGFNTSQYIEAIQTIDFDGSYLIVPTKINS